MFQEIVLIVFAIGQIVVRFLQMFPPDLVRPIMNVSLQGSLLIAAQQLRDPNFHKSVVLMLQHSSESAMGLVVNHPTGMTIGKALAQHSPVNGLDAPVFCGGPVETNAVFVLHDSVVFGNQDQEIAPGLFLAGSEGSFDKIVRQEAPPETSIQFRLISGYAGWGGGQLESEMERGDWNVLPCAGILLLDEDPYGLWELCMRRMNRATSVLPQGNHNPNWN